MNVRSFAAPVLSTIALFLAANSWCEETQMPFAHVRNSFTLIVRAPYREAVALFGPNGERGWSEGHWDPNFFYPQPGADVEGAVFAIQHGSNRSIWVNTAFDVEAGHLQYVYFLPDLLVTTIDVNLVATDALHTKVNVVYTRTALDAGANDHVRSLGESDSKAGKNWEKAIGDYLEKQKH